MFRRSLSLAVATLLLLGASPVLFAGSASAGEVVPPTDYPVCTLTVTIEGSTIRATGTNAEPNSPVKLEIRLVGDPTVLSTTTGTSDAAGNFVIIAPAPSVPGDYVATADCGATAGFTIPRDGPRCSPDGITVVPSTAAPGDVVTVVARCHVPLENVTFTLFSDPIVLGTVRANAIGTAVIRFILPCEVDPGQHRVQSQGAVPDENDLPGTVEIQSTGMFIIDQPCPITGRPDLPRTGSESLPLIRLALVLLAAGALAVFAARRRTRSVRS